MHAGMKTDIRRWIMGVQRHGAAHLDESTAVPLVRDALADALDLAGYEAEAGAMRLLPTALLEADEISLQGSSETSQLQSMISAIVAAVVWGVVMDFKIQGIGNRLLR